MGIGRRPAAAATVLLVAACSSGPAVPPGATIRTGGTAAPGPSAGAVGSTLPDASPGVGGPLDAAGSVTLTIDGPGARTVTLGFQPAASVFKTTGGAALQFADPARSEVVLVIEGPNRQVLVTYTSPDMAFPAAMCTPGTWTIGPDSGSGEFTCTGTYLLLRTDERVLDATISGSFTARDS